MQTAKFRLFAVALFLSAASLVMGQSPAERRANRLYSNYAYSDAIELYEHLLKKSPEKKGMMRNLSDCYIKTGQTEKAESWLAKALLGENGSSADYLQLAMLQESLGKREEAKANFAKCQSMNATDPSSNRYLKTMENQAVLFAESDCYRIQKLIQNSVGTDFCPTPFSVNGQNYLLVVSNGFNEEYAKSIFPWNKKRWLDLYALPLTNDSTAEKARALPRTINTKYHDGPASWNEKTKTLAFTRNNFYKGKVKRSKDRVNKLTILFASFDGKTWSTPTPFPFNNPEYSIGHPCINADGNELYFSSDMPGGYGGSDIYVSTKTGNEWSKPVNLGAMVNTTGNELFPFLQSDSLLYFSSTGWGGLGGLDIYTAQRENNEWQQAENAGSPINSQLDDFGVWISADCRTGYISSNRDGGAGNDDIYRFTFTPKPSTLTVRDQDDLTPVKDADVFVYLDGKKKYALKTDLSGSAQVYLNLCKKYSFVTNAKGYPEHVRDQEMPCVAGSSRDVQLAIRRPKAYVQVYDLYSQAMIQGAAITLNNLTDVNDPGDLGETDEKGYYRFALNPCHEYEVTVTKKGLPEVKKRFKAPCGLKDDDIAVRLGTGIAPPKGVIVRLTIVDEQTGAPVPSAKVIIKNKQDKTEQEYFADANGELEAVAREDAELEIRATRVGYFSTSRSKTAIKVPKGQKSMLETLKLLKLAEGGIIALEGIFYDLNKIEIRKDAAKVLDYVYQVLLENPTMVIEMGSHTDARDSDERNMKLSEGRAASAVAYIVAKGIEASRITSKGYGETQLKNKCGNGVKCPEAMHQENRRTEIRIVSFD